MTDKTVIIIGGGLGGLFTGAILSKEGYKVTILEKNQTIGGGLQNFSRFGVTFDTSMHIVGGMQCGGNIRRLCQWLGILNRIRILDVDKDCTDSIYFAEDKQTYRIAYGNEGFVRSLATYFPNEEENLRNYLKALYRITDEVDIFNLKPSDNYFKVHTDDFYISAHQFIEKYISDEKLRSILAYMGTLYGARKDETPAYVHAIINVLYINGQSRFMGGSNLFADLLAGVITDAGGTILTNAEVVHINSYQRNVNSVVTYDGKEYSADYYISDIHPCCLFAIADDNLFPKTYKERLNSLPNSYSAFSIYLKLKKNTFKFINHSEYYIKRYDQMWDFGSSVSSEPIGFMFMTPPESCLQEYSEKALIAIPMNYSHVRKWEDSVVGHRGQDYRQWKQEYADRVISMVEEIHPNFRNCIENINIASPLTIRDYYGVKEGSMYGFSKDYKNIIASQVPVVTKVKNLYLTGQNNSLHGFCGVALTSINTSEALLGRNYIINKLNACEGILS